MYVCVYIYGGEESEIKLCDTPVLKLFADIL